MAHQDRMSNQNPVLFETGSITDNSNIQMPHQTVTGLYLSPPPISISQLSSLFFDCHFHKTDHGGRIKNTLSESKRECESLWRTVL